MFTLKIPTLLAFDQMRSSPKRLENLKNLFGIENVPSDTSMREIRDLVNPEELRPVFKEIFFSLQRGKALECYQYLDGYYWSR